MIRALAALLLLAAPAAAGPLRVATYAPGLSREGPGVLLRDLQRGKDAQIAAAVQVIVAGDADVLLLTGIDWDAEGLALAALAERLAAAGAAYPHRFAGPPNAGLATGLDLDGDGRLGTADDAQGFGLFRGQGGMAVLSRYPLGPVRDLSQRLWAEVPGSLMPPATEAVRAVQRLSSVAHWDVPVATPEGVLHLLAWSGAPPVFDGPEDRNGRRNHDEMAVWAGYDPGGPFVLAGLANLDPQKGEGRREAWAALAGRVQDPAPVSDGAAAAGDPLDTADWPEADGPGNLRVDVVLPGAGLKVAASGVLWPVEGPRAAVVGVASAHRLVWVDLDLP